MTYDMSMDCRGLVRVAVTTLLLCVAHGNTVRDVSTSGTGALSTDEDTARAFVEEYHASTQWVWNGETRAAWAYYTNLTTPNEQEYSEAILRSADVAQRMYKKASQWDWAHFKDRDLHRNFGRVCNVGISILNNTDLDRLNTLKSHMETQYSTGTVCRGSECLPLDPDLTRLMATSNDYDELLWAWRGWRDATGKHVRHNYTEYVALANKAARSGNFRDNAEYWQAMYEDESFEEDVAALWEQLLPLYRQLHAYVRRRLTDKYPGALPSTGHIPAHLLGDMWAQSWVNKADLVLPYPLKPAVDVTPNMRKQNYTATRMFELSEDFFLSLGLPALQQSFWDNSLIVKPDDRDVVCHASAWDMFDGQDFRIKQCTDITQEWLFTTHHEMGHVQYFKAYQNLSINYRDGANPGFHEAIGDVISLSVSTPEHLYKLGLLDELVDDKETDLNFLMSMALDKLAFLPYGYLLDRWRWGVFRGDTPPERYNTDYWDLRCRLQGVSPPVARTEKDFDPAAKFHVVSHVPYVRYFVSYIIQFQFHKALCEAAGNTNPLHRCDIYNSTDAGKKLWDLLKLGASRPWSEAMAAMTGQSRMDAGPLIEYFQPLIDWLEEQNKGYDVTWSDHCPDFQTSSVSMVISNCLNIFVIVLLYITGIYIAT